MKKRRFFSLIKIDYRLQLQSNFVLYLTTFI